MKCAVATTESEGSLAVLGDSLAYPNVCRVKFPNQNATTFPSERARPDHVILIATAYFNVLAYRWDRSCDVMSSLRDCCGNKDLGKIYPQLLTNEHQSCLLAQCLLNDTSAIECI